MSGVLAAMDAALPSAVGGVLLVSALLFAIGMVGFLVRRNMIIMFL